MTELQQGVPEVTPVPEISPSEALRLAQLEVVTEVIAPQIVSREDWGAHPPREGAEFTEYPEPLKDHLNYILIHHTGEAKAVGPRVIQESQMNRGYDDIAYHFVISPDGTIYQGRPLNLMGGHAGQSLEANTLAKAIREGTAPPRATLEDAHKMDPDYNAIGIVLEGNFDQGEGGEDYHHPTTAQIESLVRLTSYLKVTYDVPRDNVMGHVHAEEALVEGRGYTFDGNHTICPGNLDIAGVRATLPPDTIHQD